MENQFVEKMAQCSDEELIKITTIDRGDYQVMALNAAEEEIKRRGIEFSVIEEVENILIANQESIKSIDSKSVSSVIRFTHFIIDSLAIIVIALLISFIVGLFYNTSDEIALQLIGYSVLLFSGLSYYIIAELRFQKTLGKLIMKTKVVTKDGQKPLVMDIVGRSFYRLIPFDRMSFLFTRNGFHDNLSGTTVIKDTE